MNYLSAKLFHSWSGKRTLIPRTVPIILLIIFNLLFPIIVKNNTVLAKDRCIFSFTDKTGQEADPNSFSALKKYNYSIIVDDPSSTYEVKLCHHGDIIRDLTTQKVCRDNSEKTPDKTTGKLPQGEIAFNFMPLKEVYAEWVEVTKIGSVITTPYCTKDYKWIAVPTPTPVQRASCRLLTLSPPPPLDDRTHLSVTGEIYDVFGITNFGITTLPLYNSITVEGATLPNPFVTRNVNVLSNTTFSADLQYGYPNGNYIIKASVYVVSDILHDQSAWANCSLPFNVPYGVLPTPTPKPPTPTPTTPAACGTPAAAAGGWCSPPYNDCPWCPKKTPISTLPIPSLGPICEQINTTMVNKAGDIIVVDELVKQKKACQDCMGPNPISTPGVWTALGCLPTDYTAIVSWFFKIGVGIAGGIAFLFFLFGAFMILTSAGNAEQIEEGKQTIISALSGLLLIIFSIFLLGVIGVDILSIPGLSK